MQIANIFDANDRESYQFLFADLDMISRDYIGAVRRRANFQRERAVEGSEVAQYTQPWFDRYVKTFVKAEKEKEAAFNAAYEALLAENIPELPKLAAYARIAHDSIMQTVYALENDPNLPHHRCSVQQ